MSPHRPTGSDAATAPPPACAGVPVAGPASSFLPAGKTVPKALFPLVGRSVSHHVAAEVTAAGVAVVTVAVGLGRESVVDHFAPRSGQKALAGKSAIRRSGGEPQRYAAIVTAGLSTSGVVFQNLRNDTGTLLEGGQNVAGRDDIGSADRMRLSGGVTTPGPVRTTDLTLGTPPESHG